MSEPGGIEAKVEALVTAMVEAGADAPFRHDDLLFFFVPLWVVRAYAAARYARADVLAAVMAAAFGPAATAELAAHPKVLAWQLARSWVARCGDLERAARGMAAPAARAAA